MAYFPIFIDLQGKDCLVAGGGRVAERKVRILLEYGPALRVVAVQASPFLRELADQGRIRLFLRAFQPEDLEGAELVIAASDDSQVNGEISRLCRQRRIPVNVVDVKEECSFLFPALVKEGDISIGISTGGKSPAMAALLKQRVRQAVPTGCAQAAAWMGEERERLKERIPGQSVREAVFQELAQLALERGEGLSQEEVEEIIGRKMDRQNEES